MVAEFAFEEKPLIFKTEQETLAYLALLVPCHILVVTDVRQDTVGNLASSFCVS